MQAFYPFLLTSLVVFLAFALKGMMGFGENLVMIPLISLLMPVKTVLPITLIVVLVADFYLVYRLYPAIARKEALRIILLAIPGIGFGSFSLAYLAEPTLKAGLGILLIAYVLIAFFQPKGTRWRHWPRGMGYSAGLAGGSLSGLIGIGGPPVVAYLQCRQLPKAVFRATCVGVFLIFDLTRLVTYTAQGLLDAHAGLKGLALIPAFSVGIITGFKLHQAVPEQKFQGLVYLMLSGVGLSLLMEWL
jgi:uncharacterized membrane protein YfcA